MNTKRNLMLKRCGRCGNTWSLRPFACAACGSMQLHDLQSNGVGTVRACSVVTRAPDARWRALAPYTVVLVALQEGPTVMGQADADVAIGDLVVGSRHALSTTDYIRFGRHQPNEQPES
ncbi:MAG TPA: OB-fold domain-containing protein [Advenella sp.]|nr:OB-fold domain-containing protein [Advenella sp.]